ncbi:MAG: hypothetical protein RQ760_12320 [Sedimentisphaerales bacterium]|nr:hypothetical protein [Sedimentisphaerales bacterium]
MRSYWKYRLTHTVTTEMAKLYATLVFAGSGRFCLNILATILAITVLLSVRADCNVLEKSAIPSFPDAEGAGAFTPGGRGGKVLEVTNLNDDGPGSLREAIEAKGPRIVIFRISGIITLEKLLTISNPYITIAGQTAPGDGICIRGQTTEINTHNVILRYLRFRRGNIKDRNDALGGYPVGNIIVDHCSASWGLDENLSLYRYMKKMPGGPDKKMPVENLTIQWCISSEALDLNNHAFGATWGGKNCSFHHNLFACNTGRNPSIGWGDHFDFRNNVLFNWRHRTVDGGDASSMVNIVANYYKPGPAVNEGAVRYRICRPQHLDMYSEAQRDGKWYVADNFVLGYPRVTADNWDGGVQFDDAPTQAEIKTLIKKVRATAPAPALPITQQSAEEAYKLVLARAGATLPKRDLVDERIIDIVHTGKPTFQDGIVDIPSDVGGWPQYNSSPAPADSDHDGMPDRWEKKFSLKWNDPFDGAKDSDGDGYTNVEEWLNGTDPTQFVDYRKPENNIDTSRDEQRQQDSMFVLDSDAFKYHVDFFNTMEPENIVNYISNMQSWAWMSQNIPFFECPDKSFEQVYYFRWWTFRKHIKKTPDGFVFTEFLDKVGHSGKYNTISCALGHHIYEGTWLHDKRYIDDYARFWFVGNYGDLQPHFHQYSNWATWALYYRYLVNQDKEFVTKLLNAFIDDYQAWEKERGLENGLYWQYDVRDGMEESISGSRKEKNARPPLNSYMYANAMAISKVAVLAGKKDIAEKYALKAARLKSLVQRLMWDKQAKFFKVRYPNGKLADVREEIGFIPWYFNLPEPGYEYAWQQLTDSKGFKAPMGIMTAERRHPQFRSHGVGTCEWDGAVWPYATSQTLVGLANVLRNYKQQHVNKTDYFDALMTYARSHRYRGKPYIGEYLDELNGKWLRPDSDRSRYYNHSTFCDLVISGLVGLIPRQDETIIVDPLIPEDAWDWFCLDNVHYHGRVLTVLWDRSGRKYHRGKGFSIFADGRKIAGSDELTHIKGELP